MRNNRFFLYFLIFCNKQYQFIKFVVVGLIVVSIDYFFYELFNVLFLMSFSNSKRISFIIGGVFSFFLNKRITFNSKKKTPITPFFFILITLISFGMNSLFHDFSFKYFTGNYPFLISTTVSALINFFGQKYIVFN
jgi:putative flippase GtrA